MNLKDGIVAMMDDSTLSRYAIAKALGKSNSYIYNLMAKKTNPSYETTKSIANVCGYDLALVKRDGSKTIVLDE